MSFFTASTLRPMTADQIIKKAPAVFAEAPSLKTSQKYLFVSTEKLVESLGKKDWHVVAAHQTMNRASTPDAKMTNHHALFLAHGNQLNSQFNAGDSLPLLKIENSHNGLSSFHMATGFFRKACANGLTVPESLFSAPKVRHTINMANDVVEAAYTVMRDFPRLAEMQRELSNVILSDEEKMLLLDSAAEIFFTPEQLEANRMLAKNTRQDHALIEYQLGRPQRYADKRADLWTTTNVIQENLIRGNVRTYNPEAHSMRSTRKVTSIDRDNDIHDKLFRLTQKFAELKGVKLHAVA
jgi:hypothetical protein